MDPKGMVHALEQVRESLVPGGVCIDIHPAGEMPPLFVRSEAGDNLIGWLQETDYFIEYRQADWAIAQAVTGGLFRTEGHREFIFEMQAGDIDELVEYQEGAWSDVQFEERQLARARQVQRQIAGPSKIILAERVGIYKLVSRQGD